jgi:hypothetical protein
MFTRFLLILVSAIWSFNSFSQNTFDLSDTSFEIGQIYTTRSIKFDLDNYRLWPDSITFQKLDSITSFLKKK